VRTEVRGPEARPRIWSFLKSEIADGGQVYVVYPLIEASESVAAAALEAHQAELREALDGLEIGVLHGRLGRDRREEVAERFRRGELGAPRSAQGARAIRGCHGGSSRGVS
jgi:ATP-dependent DNA helicase RecG